MNYSPEELERAARPLADGEAPVSYRAYHAASLAAGDIDPSYELLRYVCARFELNTEQRHWLAFLYATCYCGPTVFYIYNEFPDYETFSDRRAERWWTANRSRLTFQTDRAWVRSRNQWRDVVASYRAKCAGPQADAFRRLLTDDPQENYRRAWREFSDVYQFGRFAMFLFLEAVHVVTGWPMEPDTLEMAEAESCRNGLAFAIGRDDLMTHGTERKLTPAETAQLQAEFDRLAASMRAEDERNTIWRIETTLCAYKKYRLGKRQVGYYLGRQRHELERMQAAVPDGVDWRVLWQYRAETYERRWLTESPGTPKPAARLRVVAIGGEPATGKTTILRAVRPTGDPFQNGLLRGTYDASRRTYYLGIYDGDTFDGTDRLSMAVQRDAEAFVEAHRAEDAAVVFEGDRLFRQSFLTRAAERALLTTFIITASEETKAARHRDRADSQSEQFLKTQRTKVANIAASGLRIITMSHETTEDTALIAQAIDAATRGEQVAAPEPTVHCQHDAMVPIAEIRPNPDNPNTHSAEQLRRLSGILRANGWRRALTVSHRSGMLTKGHGRLEAAKLAGLTAVPVQFHDYESAAQELQVIIADNRAFEKGETDDAKTVALLDKLGSRANEFTTGYSDAESARILERLAGRNGLENGRAGDPAPPAAPKADRRTLSLHFAPQEFEEFDRLMQEEMKTTHQTNQSQAVLTAIEEAAR